jgi:hypothetical protein
MLLVVLAAAALLMGCSGEDDSTGLTLLDGSRPGDVAVELEDIDDAVVTSETVVPLASIEAETAAGACLRTFHDRDISGAAVVRVGVSSETVTLREAPGRGLLGCDNTPGPRDEDRRWCGSSYGKLEGGRLTDPRLNIGCRMRDGIPVGFVWVQPGEGTQYVAVAQPGYTEVYEVAGELPIRIATVDGVDLETSSATFEVSEHDAEGRLLREQTLEAFVAG